MYFELAQTLLWVAVNLKGANCRPTQYNNTTKRMPERVVAGKTTPCFPIAHRHLQRTQSSAKTSEVLFPRQRCLSTTRSCSSKSMRQTKLFSPVYRVSTPVLQWLKTVKRSVSIFRATISRSSRLSGPVNRQSPTLCESPLCCKIAIP